MPEFRYFTLSMVISSFGLGVVCRRRFNRRATPSARKAPGLRKESRQLAFPPWTEGLGLRDGREYSPAPGVPLGMGAPGGEQCA